MRLQSEVIIWHPVALQVWPDVDTMVLICTDEGDVELCSWDDAAGTWWDPTGEPVNGVLYWAEFKGPEA